MSGGRMKAWRLPEHFRLPSRSRTQIVAGFVALAGGAGAFMVAAFATRIADAGPAASVLAEESLKTLVSLALSLSCMRLAKPSAANSDSAGDMARRLFRREGAMRGLGFGLVATAAFALAENCAYLSAFPVSGVFGRLWWSTPVHLLSSMFASAGLVPALLRLANGEAATSRADEGKCGGSSGAKSAAAGAALGFAAAFFFHFSANLIVRSGASPRAMAIAGAAMLAALIIVYRALARRMYIGGIFND